MTMRGKPVMALAAVVGATLLGGCGLEPKAISPGTNPAMTTPSVFAPASLRIHPLTRIIPGEDGADGRVELYLELLDEWNDPTKELGEFVVELRATDSRARSDVQLQRWTVSLMDPDENAQAYDRVTRSYHLTLADVPPAATRERRPVVTVRFASVDGTVLNGTHAVSN